MENKNSTSASSSGKEKPRKRKSNNKEKRNTLPKFFIKCEVSINENESEADNQEYDEISDEGSNFDPTYHTDEESDVLADSEVIPDSENDENPEPARKRTKIVQKKLPKNLNNIDTKKNSENKTEHAAGDIVKEITAQEIQKQCEKSPLLDGKFFKFLSYNKIIKTDGKLSEIMRARCSHCLIEISFCNSSRSNLLRHIKRNHTTELLNEYCKYKEEKKQTNHNEKTISISSSASTATLPTMSPSQPQRDRQTKLTDYAPTSSKTKPNDDGSFSQYYRLKHQKEVQNEFNKQCAKFVTKGLHSLSIVDEAEFKKLFVVAECNVRVCERKKIRKEIEQLYIDHILLLKETLKSTNSSICITADIWSTQKKSFLGITVHWLEGFTRKSAALACRRITGKHDFIKIAEVLQSILAEFELLGSPKIVAVITDNARNFAKTFKVFGIQNAYVQDRIDAEYDEIFEIDLDDYEPNGVDGVNFDTCDEPDEATLKAFNLPAHFRCSSHTLNLVASVDFKKVISKLNLDNVHNGLMKKLNEIWKSSRRPGSNEKLMKILQCNVPYPCVTRWNSYYDSLKFILKHEQQWELLFKCVDVELPTLMEKKYLEAFCTVMKPIAEVLDKFQSEKILYGEFLPLLYNMEIELVDLCNSKDSGSGQIEMLAEGLLEHFRLRYKPFLETANQPDVNNAILATCTHPSFKLLCFKDDEEEEMKNLVFQACLSIIKETNPSSENEENHSGSGDAGFVDNHVLKNLRRRRMGDAVCDENDTLQQSKNKETTVKREVQRFFEDTRCDLDMLNDYPTIKILFTRTNVILASSASVERLFSIAKLILSERRGRLLDEMFERLLIARSLL